MFFRRFTIFYIFNYITISLEFNEKSVIRSWHRPLNYVDNPDYDPDSGSGLQFRLFGGGWHFCTVFGVFFSRF